MSVQPEAARNLRECDECREVDDLGHHQVAVPGEDGAIVVMSRHFRCCAASGSCPDGSCDVILRSAPGV
jgi:hypothetical protein